GLSAKRERRWRPDRRRGARRRPDDDQDGDREPDGDHGPDPQGRRGRGGPRARRRAARQGHRGA
ncbi:MAG: (E)-4-hydroxy-3-methylbut-2-enyl-diphosphate synthase (flavodoxin), partial [uncultured Solirubrobacteraceae bacterium]